MNQAQKQQTKDYKLRMSASLYEHTKEHADLMGVKLPDFIRDAIVFYSWAGDAVSSGQTLVIVDRNGNRRREICIPSFERAKIEARSVS